MAQSTTDGKSAPKMNKPARPEAASAPPNPPAQSQAAAQAIKALQEKNYRLECNSQVLENLLKEYKQRSASADDDKKQIELLQKEV